MRERDLAHNVVAAAKTLGWRVYFTWNSLHSPKGWPDLVALRQGFDGDTRIIFAELKSEKGKLSLPQEQTLELLRGTGHGVYVWRPSQWLSGEIAEILAGAK